MDVLTRALANVLLCAMGHVGEDATTLVLKVVLRVLENAKLGVETVAHLLALLIVRTLKIIHLNKKHKSCARHILGNNNMKKKSFIICLSVFLSSIILSSCEKEESIAKHEKEESTITTTSISKPTLGKDLTTTTTDQVSFRCRFNNGGDITDNMSCTVHWKQYGSKPSSTPKTSDLTKSETMRQYSSTSKSTTFDKTHAGFSGGTYIYYYFECNNSKYTTKSDVTYCIVKR